eukprot:173519_1
MLSVLLCCLLFSVYARDLWQQELTSAQLNHIDFQQQFSLWTKYFNRSYLSLKEESLRYKIWIENLRIIAQYNDQNYSFKLRLNKFGDFTKKEYKQYVEPKRTSSKNTNIKQLYDKYPTAPIKPHPNIPGSIDWTTKGVVTPVKDQGNCGSCWAFSATGALECNYAILHNGSDSLYSLSEQQLVSCCGKSYDCYGCGGGFTYEAFKYVRDNNGLCTETEYPYLGHNSGQCEEKTCGNKYDANKYFMLVTPDNSNALESAVSSGCTSVAVDADSTVFEYYSSGILNSTTCKADNLDHEVLVVGYGNDTLSSMQYWKVKNSWGIDWGINGYVKMCRNCKRNCNNVTGICSGECGILSYPLYPTF